MRPTQHYPRTRKQLLEIARDLYADLGDALTRRRFLHETGFPPEVIDDMFGCWRRLLRAVRRVTRRATPSLGREELLRGLRELAESRGQAITQAEFCRSFGISTSRIVAHFGSWKDMREAAGLPTVTKRRPRYTYKDLMDDLLRVYLRFGQSPSWCQHTALGGRIAPLTIKSRFGTWKRVKIAFEIYRRIYFRSHDRQWSRHEHDRTFRPDPEHKLYWPPDSPVTSTWTPFQEVPIEFQG